MIDSELLIYAAYTTGTRRQARKQTMLLQEQNRMIAEQNKGIAHLRFKQPRPQSRINL